MPAPHRAASDPSGAMAVAIGARVRKLRQAQGTSLATLATSTGLGKGTLSELERGQRNPTLDTLFAIATQLAVPLSNLIAEERFPCSVAASARAQGQSIDAILIDRWSDETGLVEIYRVSISQETRRSRAHAAGVSETLTLIDGAIEVGEVGKTVQLQAAESHSFAGDQAHHYRGIAIRSTAILVMRYPVREE
jgi:transcriptional regulator with XRE-family HTH domain